MPQGFPPQSQSCIVDDKCSHLPVSVELVLPARVGAVRPTRRLLIGYEPNLREHTRREQHAIDWRDDKQCSDDDDVDCNNDYDYDIEC